VAEPGDDGLIHWMHVDCEVGTIDIRLPGFTNVCREVTCPACLERLRRLGERPS
jgi:hypothetical protein